MGNPFSREVESIKEEHQQQINESAKRQLDEEEKQKKKIEEDRKAELEEQRRRNNAELRDLADDQVKQTEKQVKSCNELNQEREKEINELDVLLKENMKKQVEEHKKNGIDQVTEEKRKLKEEQEMLIQKKELILNRTNQVTEERNKMRKERSEMAKEYEEEERRDTKSHFEKMTAMSEEKNKVIVDGEKELDRLTVDHRNDLHGLKQQQIELQALGMGLTRDLMAIHNSDQIFEDFRRNCKQKIALFTDFKTWVDGEGSFISITCQDMEDGFALSSPPDLSDAARALGAFQAEIQNFDLEGARSSDQEKFSNLRQSVQSLLEELRTVMEKIVKNIGLYKSRYPNGSGPSNSQMESFDSRASSDIEDLDSVTSTAPSSVKNFKGSPIRTQEGLRIDEHWKAMKKLIERLNKEMLEFNVPASTEFDDALSRQFNTLTTRQSEIVGQITNGIMPSTSSTAQRVTGASSNPSIQQVEEPNEESS